ncbi:MAG: hypothetical protein IMZ65_01670, partial [Planctomycetes bacterium]|nr:hypothetical protein [Planctomycetota bacterium]
MATIRTMAAPADRRRELMLGQIRDGHSGRCRVDPRLSYNRPVMNLLYYG